MIYRAFYSWGGRKAISRVILAFLLVTIVFIGLFWRNSHAGVEEGKGLYNARKCSECHLTIGPNPDKTFADKLKHKGPDLWFAGSKFKKEWLKEWLKSPNPIRPMEYNSIEKKNPGNHPKLSDKEAEEATEYLMTFKSKDVAVGVIKEGASNMKGKLVFEKKQGCYGCHSVKRGAKVLGGLSGPSLIDAGKRLQGDWIYAYLKNPQTLIPVKRMPNYAGILTDEDLKNLAAHVASF